MIIRQCILVLLAIFMIMGCVGAVEGDVIPTVTLSSNVTSGTGIAPLPIAFTYTVINATSTSWTYDENSSSPNSLAESSGTLTHTYMTAGSYTANLTATNENGTVSKTVQITVVAPILPTVTLSSNLTSGSGIAPLSVAFPYEISNADEIFWTYDESSSVSESLTSSSGTLNHTYTTAGSYTANLTARNGNGTTYDTVSIIVAQPVTNITSISVTGLTAPVYGGDPDIIVSVLGGGTPESVSWTPAVSTFADNFEYIATITIRNASGYVFNETKPVVSLNGNAVSSAYVIVNTATQELTITHAFPKTAEVEKILPTVTLKADVFSGTLPLTVKFTYSVSGWNNYTWTDGETSSTLPYMSGNLSHTYTKAGTYTANLTARNENGTTTKTVTITVNKVGLNAAFTASPGSGTAPLKVRFTDTSAGSPTTWLWDFGGLGSSTLKNPSFTFTDAGNYIVKLTILDGTGAADAYSSVISVHAPVITSTSTPAPTNTSSSLSMSYGTGNITSLIPAPLDVIKEFIQLFYTLLDMQNYVGVSNQTNTV